MLIILVSLLSVQMASAQSDLFSIRGKVIDTYGKPVADATVKILPIDKMTITDESGNFSFKRLTAGDYDLTISHIAFEKQEIAISLGDEPVLKQTFTLFPNNTELKGIDIVSRRSFQTMSFLPAVEGTEIMAGKKTKLINLQRQDVNLAENLPRQVFAKAPGAMIWEMDGTGNQVGLAMRGLIPHRSWELHVQQNGNTTNSDLFGYPESHYNPPMEAVGEIKMVSGSGALQYGPQFGGLLDYEIKKPDTSKTISFETQQTVGSFGLFGSFNAIGGKVGKLTYYGYYNFRRSEGWRDNSDYHFQAWHGSLKYDFSNSMYLSAELSHMDYVNHFAAGLTDSLFEADARFSNRPRNYFNPTIYVPALHYSWKISPNTELNARASGIFGERNSVQFITLPTTNDTINHTTNDYNPRQVDRDTYNSYSSEVRLRQQYDFLKQKSHFSAGIRYGNSRTIRKQKGKGTTSIEFDLSLIEPYRIDLVFETNNYALFAENLFQLSKKLSFTPGFRYEMIDSEMSGELKDIPSVRLPFTIKRNFPLFGAGLEYAFSNTVTAYANFTQNFRPILHSDLIPPTDLDQIDPDLKDAKGNNAEIGIRGTLKNILQFDINYFRLQYDNRIGTIIVEDPGNTYFFHTNVGDMVNQGAECYVEFFPFNIGQSSSGKLNFSIFSSTAYNSAEYTRGTVRVSGENRDVSGNKVENVPQWISRNGLNYRYRNFSGTLQLSYVSDNYSDALNTESTATGVNGVVPAYLLTDLNFSYRFMQRYNVRLSINNLTDERYYTRRATGYPGPGILPSDGRSVVVSFGATF
ncbi:MAG: TonB-dependent receptor [Saprospiraceae bacterium]